ncbi:NADPH:sulfur oxidoreductase [Balamuthia mandrillaris]
MGQAETKPQQTPQAGASPQQQSRGGSKVLPRSASSSGGSGSSVWPRSTSSTHVSSGSTAAASASAHSKGEAPPPCHSIPLQGVYLDLSSRCLTDLSEEPPSELLPFMQPPNLLAGEEAVLTVLESLSLAHNKLPSLEGLECVLHLPLLVELDAHDNLLELVDDDVLGMMANLERLNISKNKLTSLPNHFSFLQNLRELNLANNQLSELPAELGKLSKLLSLNVANNKLKELPQSLRKLHGLKKMIASNNYLTRFLELKSGDLPRLVWLDLSWNSIKDFPKLSVLANTLEKLYLEHNGLKTVDPLEIGQLKHLRELSLASNDLKALPQQISALRQHLAVLDISDNKFSQKEYQTQDVQALLLWLEDPKANPIHEIVREEPPAPVYEQSTQYVEEGFFVEGYKNQLFRFKGKHNIRMQMMEAKCSSLNEGDSFILDIGRKLFVWFGPLSNERERAKALYTGKALAAEELGGVPVILINEHDDKDFWEVLGGNNDIQTAEEGGDDAFWEQHWNDNKTLFKFSGEKGLDTIDGSESDFLGVMLNSNHAYVLHCGSTIFLWCGKESQSSQRSRALQKAEDLRQELHLQESDISWIIDGAETIYFREQFVDWSDESLWEMDYKDWPCVNPSRDTYRPPRRGTGVTMPPVKKPPAQADAISKEKEKEKEVVVQSLEQEPAPDSKKKKTRAALKAEKAGSVANADEDEARKRLEELEKQRRDEEEQEREKEQERERERERQRKEAAIKEEKEKELERERERQKEKQLQQEREQSRKEAEERRQQELEQAKKEEAERENERRQREEEERQRLIEKQKEKQRQFEQERQKEQEARDKAKEEQRKKERLEREEKERQEERARLEKEREKERQKAKEEEEKRKKELERQRELEKQKEKEREREKERAREQEEKQKEIEKQKLAKAEKEKLEREQQERKQKEEREKREKEEQERKKREEAAAEKQRELEKEKERQRQRSQEDTGSTIAVRSAIFNQPSPTPTDDQSISPRSGAPKFAVKVDKCTTCGKRVYLTEKITVENMPYHKSCFRCSHCNNVLKPGNYASLQGKLYCKPHFKQLFQLKGNYAGGFGQKKPEEVWLENKQSGGATDDAANNKATSSDTTTTSITTTATTSVSPRAVMANPSPPTLSKEQSSTLPSPRGALPQFSGAGSVIARRPTVGPVSSKESLDGDRAVQTLRPKNSVLAAAAVFGGSKLSGGGSAIFLRRSEDKDKQKEEDDEPKQVAKEEEAGPIYDDAVVSLSKQFPDMGIERIQTAVDLFEKWDINKTGFLGKAQYLRLMQRVIGADRFAGGPMFQRLLELAFSHVDSAKRGKIDKTQFLRVYNEMFSNERRQTALLLTVEFPGMTVEQIEEGLKKFEEYTRNKGGDELIDIDEFYQLREELGPNVKKLAQKIFQQAHGQSTAKLDTNQFLSAYEELFDTRSPALAKDGKRKDKKEKKKERKEKKEKKTKKDRKEKKKEQTTAVPTTETKAPTANIKKSSPALPSGRKPDTIFEEFQNATELEDILCTFTELKLACGLESNAMGLSVMDHIRKKITLVNSEVLWQLLEHRKNQVEYRTGFENNPPRAVVVGSGPGGLRSAIELCLLGARVTVLEKRTEFSRNNLVHIWHSSIRDLKNIGTKFFYPKFCVGGINHIAIRTLQGVLLKIALLLGIRFLAATAFFKVHHLGSSGKVVVCNPSPREFHWRVEASPVPTDKQLFNDFQPDDLLCDILIGADGENSVVAREMGFTRKVLQGGRAIGITANFKNTQTKEERRIREFGLLAVYNQGFFNELKQNYNIELENLVYYRGETHYFVMTAKTQSLVDRKVFKENEKEITRLLARDNVDRSALELYVRDVATHIKLPSHCEFAVNPNGLNDVAIFDFSKKQQATKPYQIVGEEERRCLYVALVGDALIEPFWPLGTGVNRAILGALDSAWMIKGMFGERGDQVSAAQLKKMENAWLSDFKVMMNSSPEDLVGNFGLHTIDPKTRYKKNTLGHFH